MRDGSSVLEPHGDGARIIGHEIVFELVAGALVFALILVLLALIVVRQRGRPADVPPAPETDAGHRWIWLGGIALPLAVLTVVVAVTMRDLWSVEHATGSPVRTIEVKGHRWWWEVRYAGTPAVSANELALPVGQPVRLVLTTGDVIHSFWIPELGRKVDMVPGQVAHFDLTAEKPGVFRGECAEFCGLQHAHMTLRVQAMAPGDFAAWLRHHSAPAARPATPGAQEGQRIFMSSTCVACHTIAGTRAAGSVGPDLTHLAARAQLGGGILPNNRGNLGGWITDPQHIKHGVHMPATALRGTQLQRLLDYLESLR
jgi:cytochrome c oxidase subunit 2